MQRAGQIGRATVALVTNKAKYPYIGGNVLGSAQAQPGCNQARLGVKSRAACAGKRRCDSVKVVVQLAVTPHQAATGGQAPAAGDIAGVKHQLRLKRYTLAIDAAVEFEHGPYGQFQPQLVARARAGQGPLNARAKLN